MKACGLENHFSGCLLLQAKVVFWIPFSSRLHAERCGEMVTASILHNLHVLRNKWCCPYCIAACRDKRSFLSAFSLLGFLPGDWRNMQNFIFSARISTVKGFTRFFWGSLGRLGDDFILAVALPKGSYLGYEDHPFGFRNVWRTHDGVKKTIGIIFFPAEKVC